MPRALAGSRRQTLERGQDLAREAPDQGLDEAAKQWPPAPSKQNCTLATAQQQSRWESRRLPKTWVEPSRFVCTSTLVRHCLLQTVRAKRSTSRFSTGGSRRRCAAGSSQWRRSLTEMNSFLRTQHLTSERSEMLMRLVNCFLYEASDTCADGQPRAHWPRLRESDRSPHTKIVVRVAHHRGRRRRTIRGESSLPMTMNEDVE